MHTEIQVSLRFAMKIRIPGWLRDNVVPSDLYRYSDTKNLCFKIKVNGEEVNGDLDKDYFVVNRTWKKGDVIDMH